MISPDWPLIGADPEFFLRRGNHWVSGHIFDLGTKQKPKETEHGSIQNDGVAVEINVTPTVHKRVFVQNVFDLRRDVLRIVGNEYSLVSRPSVFFGHRRLTGMPFIARDLGCNIDYNAYTRQVNPKPDVSLPFRTGAGHIHIGWTEKQNPRNLMHFAKCCHLTKILDLYLGVPSLIWDKDDRRRKLYGLAGAFRPKPYGLEYRVLSNAWLDTPELTGWVFERAQAAYCDMVDGTDICTRYPRTAELLINGNEHNWNSFYSLLGVEVLK